MSIIWHILQNKKITDYLEKKGHFPVKQLGQYRLSYLCPFPDHKETKPSFVVWTNSEYENFRCFGCTRNWHIIHLVSELEGISFRKAVDILSAGLEISLEDDIESQIELFDKQYSQSQPYNTELAVSMSAIASLGRLYLKSVPGKPSEKKMIDSIYESVDKDLLKYRFDLIDETAESMKRLLPLRREKIERDSKTT